MTEVLFYELDRQSLEAALASLLERSLDRGWKAVVQAGGRERVEALDTHLWTYRDDAFLAHGTQAGGHADLQPVYLTDGDENPNGAEVRFFVDGAPFGDISAYERVVYLFDGHDGPQKEAARGRWREAASAGNAVTYWKQDGDGRWVKQA